MVDKSGHFRAIQRPPRFNKGVPSPNDVVDARGSVGLATAAASVS